MSKHFKKEEIKGYIMIDGKKVTYLKTGVKCLKFNDDLGTGEHFEQLNQEIINHERRELALKILFGGDDFEDHTPKFEN